MNTGAFGEGFPYTNFHDLNMDWIIKIAKDFLDQYTHIQQVIADGETSLQNLTTDGLQQLQNSTTEGLQQLQDKATALEALLQAWYNEHSEDIANQLTSALADLNTWYTQHEGYLDQYVQDTISAFNTAAELKAAQTIESIPDDYTELSNTVTQMQNSMDIINNALFTPYDTVTGYYVAQDGTLTANENAIIRKYKVTNGQKFAITNRYGYSVPAYVTFSENNEVSSYFNDSPETSIIKTNILTIDGKSQELWVNSFTLYWGLKYPKVYLLTESDIEMLHHVATGFYQSNGTRAGVGYYNYTTLFFHCEPYTLYDIGFYYGSAAVGITLWSNGSIDQIMFDDSSRPVSYQRFTIRTGDNNYLGVTCKIGDPNTLNVGIHKIKTTPYSTIKWCAMGDSLTELNIRTHSNYYENILSRLGMEYYKNEGHSGIGYKHLAPFYNQIISMTNADYDVLTIFGSVNDLGKGYTLGTYTDTSTDTIAGCINRTITEFINKTPTKKLILITPIPSYTYCTDNLSGEMENYSNMIVQIAKYRGVPVLDLYHNSGLMPWLSSIRDAYFSKDSGNGTHPNEYGHRDFIAPHIEKILTENLF